MISYTNNKKKDPPKRKVEDCSLLDMKHLRLMGLVKHPGTLQVITWSDRNKGVIHKAKVSLHIDFAENDFYTKLSMSIFNCQEVDFTIEVKMDANPCPMGGHRFYFRCPLKHNGVVCGRRVSKLFAPEGTAFFGCKECHDLAHKSTCEGPVMRRVRKMGKLCFTKERLKQQRRDSFKERDRELPTFQSASDTESLRAQLEYLSESERREMLSHLKAEFEPGDSST